METNIPAQTKPWSLQVSLPGLQQQKGVSRNMTEVVAVGSSRQEEAAASKLSLVLAKSPIADHQNLSRCRPGGMQPFLSPAEQGSSSLSLAPKGFPLAQGKVVQPMYFLVLGPSQQEGSRGAQVSHLNSSYRDKIQRSTLSKRET